jgi:hypothetical protein
MNNKVTILGAIVAAAGFITVNAPSIQSIPAIRDNPKIASSLALLMMAAGWVMTTFGDAAHKPSPLQEE